MYITADCDMNVKAAVLLYLVPVFSQVCSAPSREISDPWVKPCGGEKGGALSAVLDSFKPQLNLDLKIILRKCESIQEADRELSNVIEATRIEDEEEADKLRLVKSLDGFPDTNLVYTADISIEDLLERYYVRVSVASVFVEQARTEFSPYRNDVTVLQRRMTDLLCQISLSLLHQKRNTPEPVGRDVMPDSYRSLPNTASQDIRNFLVCRDTARLIRSLTSDVGRFVK